MKKHDLKEYFREPTISEVKSNGEGIIITNSFVDRICELNLEQYGIINRKLLPQGSRAFVHHGALVNLDAEIENTEILKSFEELFFRAFNPIINKPTYGYENRMGFRGGVPRVFPFVNCLEGARIFSYAHQKIFGLRPIEIEGAYDGRLRNGQTIEGISVTSEGASLVINLPSRRKGISRYQIKIHHVPTMDNEHKFDIALNTYGEIASPDQVHDIRFEGEYSPRPSTRHLVSGLEVAAMLAVAEYYYKEGNPVPAQLCPVFLPSEKLVDFYKKILGQCLVRIEGERDRKLTKSELSNLINKYIWIKGYDEARWISKRDPKLKDYNWKI